MYFDLSKQKEKYLLVEVVNTANIFKDLIKEKQYNHSIYLHLFLYHHLMMKYNAISKYFFVLFPYSFSVSYYLTS